MTRPVALSKHINTFVKQLAFASLLLSRVSCLCVYAGFGVEIINSVSKTQPMKVDVFFFPKMIIVNVDHSRTGVMHANTFKAGFKY